MARSISRSLLLLALVVVTPSWACTARDTATAEKDAVLAARIERLVEAFLMSDDDAGSDAARAEAWSIVEREGIPTTAKVGDAAAYGFVLINILGQPPDTRRQFFTKVQAATRDDLPDDALVFAAAQRGQMELEDRHQVRVPSSPELRSQIASLSRDDQAVRAKEGFDLERMVAADQRMAGPLRAIFDRYGVPTYDMVGVQAANDFVVMVQHQSPAFRVAALPGLKANVDEGQADPAMYATVYDRTQRDNGKNQLYGQQLECVKGSMDVAPLDDPANVNLRRAELGLMRLELYARIVRLRSPDLCAAIRARE